MLSVAVTGGAMPSLTLTVKILSPASASKGVPESAPSGAMASHAGPLTLAKVRVLLSTSVLAPASVWL